MTDDWKKFEKLTRTIQQQLAPEAEVTHNEMLLGKSGVSHQCDVVLRAQIGQYKFLAIIECKDWKNKIGIEVIRDFQSKISDIGAMKGVVVSAAGFTLNAKQFAQAQSISLYKLIDAQSIKWRDEALIPIVLKKFHLQSAEIKTIHQETNEQIGLVDKDGNIAPEEKTYLFDSRKNRYLLLKAYIEERWDEIISKRDIPKPSEVFETDKNHFYLYEGNEKHIPVILKISFYPEFRIYHGHLSLIKCQGLLDQETGELLTDEYVTSPLIFREIIENWPWKSEDNQIPIQPMHHFWMGHFFSKREQLPPEAVIIHHKGLKSTKGSNRADNVDLFVSTNV